MLESGIDPATVRFEVGRPAYCKYNIFLLENGFENSALFLNHHFLLENDGSKIVHYFRTIIFYWKMMVRK